MAIDQVGNKCCGCRGCLQKCKFGAITFATDKYGFEYPKIDPALCISCGLCEQVCPILNDVKTSAADLCGMAYALDGETKFNGSSGGLFGTFAESVIAQGGAVFGAAFDDGLKLYLKKEYENLLTIDFVCHGVGSQELFDRSIAYTQAKENIEIKKVMLRHKTANASSHYYCYYYVKDGKYREKTDLYFSFPYYNAYCKQLVCRDSCYDCKFASRARVGDLTIGDFHTVEKYFPDVDRFAGVSMFLVNTQKGQRWFDLVKDKLHWQEMDKETIYENNRFSDEVVIPAEQPAFMESVATEPFETTVKRFLKPSRDWKKLMYYHAPKFLRKLIMKLR